MTEHLKKEAKRILLLIKKTSKESHLRGFSIFFYDGTKALPEMKIKVFDGYI